MHLDEAGIAIPFPQVDVHFDPPAADTPERMN
jgi:small-conductance mechanosensitive channel